MNSSKLHDSSIARDLGILLVEIWAIDCGGVDGFLFGDLGDRLRWGWTGFYLEILLLCFVYG